MAARVPARLSPAEGRRFGLTLAAAFIGVGALAWWRGHMLGAQAVAGLGLFLLAASLLVPAQLGSLYRLWMGLATTLSKITTPVVLGAVYFALLTPTGLLRRLAGHNAVLRSRVARTFWVPREARQRTDMERQF